ncbi:CENP-Q, a CENPA-CAD centromere complex subunit-domain-containing protein [Ampelomyces quisqualis]|uniref:CENP-Q, a CENPA-CAD centromere complex subunit-domain-containing protein n=1 Tax=Ampelomyces quisqualis TaxID=50730 RepID=A0A6A5QPV1_AMPQU|nr:CENP-Q, a CENPA-CAD centromere complex subunit-domain-containing protein [Ampelomyces quisqualis]
MAPTRSGQVATRKRRGRPPGSRTSDATTRSTQKPTATEKTTRKRQRIARPEAEDGLSAIGPDTSQAARPRTRRAHTEPDEIAGAEPRSRKKYVQLEAKTRRIPQEQINAWPQVSPQVLEQMEAVIRDAKRDIANTQRDERRLIAAHRTLNPLVRKLTRQLAASRIPPQAKDIHFNIDKLTERNAQVAREVTTARHSKQLLSEQVQVAEHLLENEEHSLEELKKTVKKWRTEWKHQEKHGRVHPLLRDSDKTTINGDGPDEIGLRQSAAAVADTALLDAPDDELAVVLGQLQRSLESMQGNHAHVDGINGALTEARAALDNVLFRHASAQQDAAL